MKNKLSKKAITLIAAAALLIALAVGGTVAFLTGTADPVTNTFTPGEVVPEVVMTESGDITSITVKNVKNIPAFIRVAVVANTLDNDGNVTGNVADSFYDEYFAASGWTKKSDSYYYYDSAVQPGAFTGELIKDGKTIPVANTLVTVLAEAIQAEGMGASNAYNAFQIAKGGA